MASCQLQQEGSLSLGPANGTAVYDWVAAWEQLYRPVHPLLASVICCLGVAMNAACAYVLTRPAMVSSPVNCLLSVVAVCDAVTMSSCLYFVLRRLAFRTCADSYAHDFIVFLLVRGM